MVASEGAFQAGEPPSRHARPSLDDIDSDATILSRLLACLVITRQLDVSPPEKKDHALGKMQARGIAPLPRAHAVVVGTLGCRGFSGGAVGDGTHWGSHPPSGERRG
jgi:hypothetical protein